MLELATLAANFLAFALLHGAEPRRRPARFRDGATLWRQLSRVLALGLLLSSVAILARIEGTGAAVLVVLTMFSTAATVFVLAVPVFPRVTWGAALACVPSIPLLVWFGGLGG